jgi:thiol-disulfide isomerase/thioredoxin
MYGEEEDIPVARGSQFLSFFKDWGIALLLTALGFLLLSYVRTPRLPDQAPDWSLKDLDGDVVSLSDFRGQTVVLNFWATWCGPCKTEIPTFSKFSNDNPDIPVLGIAVDGTVNTLKRASKVLGISYPVLLADSQIKQEYKVSSLPTTVVIDPEGKVKDVHVGIMFGPQLNWATR